MSIQDTLSGSARRLKRERGILKSDSKLKEWKRLLSWPFVLLVLFFWWRSLGALNLTTHLERVQGNEGWLVVGILAAGLYLLGQAVVWRTIMTDLVASIPWLDGMRIWTVSNMGRYLPGSVWHLVGRVYLSESATVSRTSGAVGVLLEQALQLLSAMVLVTLSLPFWPAGSAVRQWSWLAVLIPFALVGLYPRLLFPILNGALRRVGRKPIPSIPSYRQILRYLGYYLVVHLCNGLALAFAAVALDAPVAAVPAMVGGALFAWTVGYLTILSPGGLGVREAFVTAALGPLIGAPVAAIAALLWRAANIVTEALAAGSFQLLAKLAGGAHRQV